MSSMEFVVETDRLIGGYGKSLVLREVSLRVPRASIYGFLGPNGAGKTTALRMVLGLLRPVSGEIRLFGEPLEAALPAILRRTGSLIEQPSLYDHLTGKENLEIARRLKFLRRSDTYHAIEALGIGEYIGKKVEEYSRGMRQRLGVAIAILGNPELLILDEPMNGLDASGLRTFRWVLQELHREYRTTILLSSHQFEEIEQVATHIGIISGAGDLLFQGPRERLSARVPQDLVIKVDRWDDALKILTSGNFTVESRREHLVIPAATGAMAREVNRLLVTNGIGVHHLALDSATLEALFVKVTTTVKAWDSV
jgi:lantibiotic transport system ATP-binding protein